ncbi:DNA glycosylase [Xylona heveae TC161]|uniref:DNA glycosylase n=1 Tax=Xylona heveae (strain CBS 132557 / TC161) TaxID=1328760 RepID=A0A165FC11_XYLHT|nr:DNA glycosylase [Xylona heveae TC161]KZF20805.1 DNA glycosylase [Xylona heveae TC161]
MSGRATRASAAKATAAISSSYNSKPQAQSTSEASKVTRKRTQKPASRPSASGSAARPKPAPRRKVNAAKTISINGSAPEADVPTTEAAQDGETSENITLARAGDASARSPDDIPDEALASAKTVPGKRKRKSTVKIEDDPNELPHNLGKLESPIKSDAAKQKRGRFAIKAEDVFETKAIVEKASSNINGTDKAVSPKKAGKGNPYGLTPGKSPFPNWPHPTPEECADVVRLLSSIHGEVKAPETIPPPSVTVSGCGEVPSILDALIRTLLSAATTGTNSSRAFQGLIQKFGILQEGIGKGSVDWDKVRLSDTKDIFEAIKCGGLADTKSKNIKAILELVHEQNKARRDALVEAKKENHDDEEKGPAGVENETDAQKEAEIARAENHVLSLDHLHALSSDDALNELIKFPGIGPKTASCVLLFCMRRPSFAVDTHVFRLCKWLGWVPSDKATRNTTYSHCDVRIPDELKYPLHALFIRHGKTCPRCRASTGQSSEGWGKGCPIEHLVKRSGKRKGGADLSPTKKRKRVKKEEESDEDEGEDDMALDGDDDEDLSDVPDDLDDDDA